MRRRSITKFSKNPYSVFTKKSSNPLKSPTNEDKYSIKSFPNFFLFAVFDGHMGDTIVNYSSTNFLRFLGNYIISYGPSPQTIANAFRLFDQKLLTSFPNSQDGCTATVVYIDSKKILTANIGDSYAILLRNLNNRIFTKYLSVEHSWENKLERKRITDLGGKFEEGYYVLGNNMIQPTRGFGDFSFKQKKGPKGQEIYTSTPSITEIPIESSDITLLLCTDGIGPNPHLTLTSAHREYNQKNYLKFIQSHITTNKHLFGNPPYYPDDLTTIVIDIQTLRKKLREMSQQSIK